MNRTILKRLSCFAACLNIFTLVGCGHHAEPPAKAQLSTNVSPSSHVSYRFSVQSKNTVTVETASAPLVKKGTQFNSTQALVVAATVPSDLSLEAVIYDPSVQISSSYAVTGVIKTKGTVTQNIADAAFVTSTPQDGMVQIQFSVNDMKKMLLDTERSSIEVSLLVFEKDGDPKNPSATIVFEIETPPSKMSSVLYLPMTTYETEKKVTIPLKYKSMALPNGETLELIGLMDIKNEEGQAYDVQVPLYLTHEFNLISVNKSVTATDCNHNVSEVSSKTKLDSTIQIHPLGSNKASALDANTSDPHYSIRIAKDAVVHLGLYSNRKEALAMPKSELKHQTVPNRCVARCNDGAEGDWADGGKWGDSCVACGHTPGNVGEQCLQCMRSHSPWCRWQHWSAWTEYTDVSLGRVYQLELVPESLGQFSNFYLAAKQQSSPVRPMRMIPKTVTITNSN